MGEPIDGHATATRSLPIPAGNPQRLVGVIVAPTADRSRSTRLSEAHLAGRGRRDAAAPACATCCCGCAEPSATSSCAPGTGCGWRPAWLRPATTSSRRPPMRWPPPAPTPSWPGSWRRSPSTSGDAPVFVDFEYDEWAVAARRDVDQQLIGLLDLLSVQAEDAGDLPAAQALAERALRLDRYTDSRYVRLAELLTMQDRVAAAIAVLDDAAAVARELGDGTPGATKRPPRRAAAPGRLRAC